MQCLKCPKNNYKFNSFQLANGFFYRNIVISYLLATTVKTPVLPARSHKNYHPCLFCRLQGTLHNTPPCRLKTFCWYACLKSLGMWVEERLQPQTSLSTKLGMTQFYVKLASHLFLLQKKNKSMSPEKSSASFHSNNLNIKLMFQQ